MRLHNFLVFLLVSPLISCSTLTRTFPSTLEKPSKKTEVELKSKGKILISQYIPKEIKKKSCTHIRKRMEVRLESVEKDKEVRLHFSCKLKPGHVVFYPRKFQSPGKYLVSINRKSPFRHLSKKPELYVRYLNADFNSGEDQAIAGANVLGPDGKAQGDVNYSEGDRTDWVHLKGKSAYVQLTLLKEPKKGKMRAHVYRYSKQRKRPKYIATLKHKKRKSFKLRGGNLLVKFVSNKHAGASKYTLLRKDSAVTRLVKVPVIDSYRVSDSGSVLLLGVVDGLKVQEEIQVRGYRESGKRESLGTCLVTSVMGQRATCRLDRVVRPNIVRLNAQFRVEG